MSFRREPSAMWPVAKQTLKAAVRYRFVVVLGLSLLVIVFGVPLLLKRAGVSCATTM